MLHSAPFMLFNSRPLHHGIHRRAAAAAGAAAATAAAACSAVCGGYVQGLNFALSKAQGK
jgi:hypothetical protein